MSDRRSLPLGRAPLAGLVVALVAAVVAPMVLGSYGLFIATLGIVYSVGAIGMILLIGEADQLSLGAAAFFAVGAYGTEILVQDAGLPWLPAVALAVVFAGVAGGLLALPAMRLEHIYLAIATLGFVLVVQQVLTSARSWTGGAVGMATTGVPSLFGLSLSDPAAFLRFCVLVLVLGLFVAENLKGSRWGRAMRAMRDSAPAARAAGIRLERVKIVVFVVSSMYVALSGALYAHLVGYLSAPRFGMFLAIELIVMAVIGGPASLVLGAVLGGFFVAYMPELLREAGEAQIFLYGLVLVVVAIWAPKGLGGLVLDRLRRRRDRRAAREASTTASGKVPAGAGVAGEPGA